MPRTDKCRELDSLFDSRITDGATIRKKWH